MSPTKSTGTYQDLLNTSTKEYNQAHPQSRHAHQIATASLPGGNTRTSIHATPFPLTISHAQGCILTTVDQHDYTDFLSEHTVALFGHSNPRIIDAVTVGLSHGYNYGAPNPYERELAWLVCRRFAPAMELVRFTNSGTESNMMAIAAAKAFTKRPYGRVLVFQNGYHGSTLSFREGVSIADDPLLLPHRWVVGPYDDIAGTKRALAEVPAGELAAIVVEPLQGSAGAVACSAEFLQYLRDEATSRGALMICDEVMTSRLAYGGLAQEMGVRPDLMTLGKWIGGGMTAGAFGGRREVMELFDPERSGGLSHAGTFNNNILTMIAGCEALKIYDEKAMTRLNALGEELKRRVNDVLGGAGLGEDGDKRRERMWMSGRGSILAMRFAGPNLEERRALYRHHMLECAIFTAPKGFVAMNIEHDAGDVEKFVTAVERYVHRYVPSPKLQAML